MAKTYLIIIIAFINVMESRDVKRDTRGSSRDDMLSSSFFIFFFLVAFVGENENENDQKPRGVLTLEVDEKRTTTTKRKRDHHPLISMREHR